jgi:hypothetical protein
MPAAKIEVTALFCVTMTGHQKGNLSNLVSHRFVLLTSPYTKPLCGYSGGRGQYRVKILFEDDGNKRCVSVTYSNERSLLPYGKDLNR